MRYLGRVDDAPHLSFREHQIVELVAQGQSAKEVGAELGIAHRTVERHIENARYKMRARNKTHMIAKAVICGELVLSVAVSDDAELNAAPKFFFGNQQM